ncbi:hypothetical protein M2163_002192 [Streptomyces sp. SAI-135]|uniref:hypothetical protein n=1 Tax=unclassified Streptomyces TaxID=2593676 RepID=UPI002475E493|nr:MULTISPECIES: hypothetical protein [unclassified Streptomyces]MDH6520824.1 hypothetical protein [Streptomyces sp. SAI-090]MDH6615084.1 hypothetical protein [Streptomyces sp. SAI-135]
MLTSTANDDIRTSFWPRVREFAVPASMIETATVRRLAGDWAGAFAAAGFDVDLNLRAVARDHGRDLASRVRTDLRALAPDLLRWHMPRIAPDGLLRPGLTLALARYDTVEGPVHLVARTAPAWADAGQRISLALWSRSVPDAVRHPHPRPNRRFRLDLHRHLWDASRAGELRARSGAGGPPGRQPPSTGTELAVPAACAVDRWGAEARILLAAEGRAGGCLSVRWGGRRRLVLELAADDGPIRPVPTPSAAAVSALPVLPDAATWVPPDLRLLRAGAIEPDRLHPLVAEALAPDRAATGPARTPDPPGRPRVVECRGARHRIGLVDGALAPLDHDPDEIRREELLVALTGTPLPCLQAIDEAHRRPHCLDGVRERLVHGDTAGALAVVEGLLGPEALLRPGPLRDELEAAALRRVTYGLFRAGLTGPGPTWFRPRPTGRDSRTRRARPRHTH